MKEKIFDIVKNNLKNPKFYGFILIAIVVLLLLFPYIDANYFYYNRVEKRIKILKSISEIDESKIELNPILSAEYDSVIEEISKQKDGSLGSVFVTRNSPKVNLIKLITGGILSWAVAFLCLFVKFDKTWYKFAGLILFALIGIVLGYISTKVPTIINPMCNYIMMPLLQLVVLGILATSNRK